MLLVCRNCGRTIESPYDARDYVYNGDKCYLYYNCYGCGSIQRQMVPDNEKFKGSSIQYYGRRGNSTPLW